MFVHKVLFEFLEFKHPRLLLVSTSDTSTGGGLLGVKFLASENWCGRVHFGGYSPEWRVLAKFSVQPCACLKGRLECKFFSSPAFAFVTEFG